MTSNSKLYSLHIFVIILILSFATANAQLQKYDLSRQDSAKINEYLSESKEQNLFGHKKESSRFLNFAATVYWEHNHFDKAIDLYTESLKINEFLGNENATAMINSNLALIYNDDRQDEKALEFFRKTLTVRKVRKEKVGIISSDINISVVLNNLKRYDESIKYLQEALDYARELNDPKQMRSCYGMLSETYEKAGKAQKAKYYFDLYRNFHEMVQEEKIGVFRRETELQRLKTRSALDAEKLKEYELMLTSKELKETESELETAETTAQNLLDTLTKKELKVELLKKRSEVDKLENEKKLRKKQTNEELNIKNITVSQQNEEINTQKEQLEFAYTQIEKAHKDIKDSINYAQFIQTSMLNKSLNLAEYFPNSFIIYKPKHTVSGDFYWYSQVDESLVVVAADCTGHGVPGGFLSMLGNNLFNTIVNNNKIINPSEILYELDKGVVSSLNQKSNKNKDDMDLSIITIIPKEKKFLFAGAKNPLLITENGKVQKIKASSSSIGNLGIAKDVNKSFETNEFTYTDKTRVYLFSDGMQDQFGGNKNRKYGQKRLREFIDSSNDKSIKEQGKAIETEFEQWKENTAQLDDVLFIGIELNNIQLV